MGRLGVTYEQFKAAADQVIATHQFPTIEKVRQTLGTGSNTTLNLYLNRWKDEWLKNYLAGTKETTLPDPVQRALTEVWEILRTESGAENERIRSEANEQVNLAKQEKEETEKKLSALQEHFNNAELKINHLTADLQLKNEALNEERKQRLVLEERISQSEARLQELREETSKRVKEQEQFYLEKIRSLENQLDVNAKNHAHEVNQLKELTETMRQKYILEIDQLIVAKQKLEKIQIKIETEVQQQQIHNKTLEEAKRLLEVDLKVNQQKLVEQSQQISILEKDNILLKAEIAHKTETCIDLKKELHLLQEKLDKMLEQIGQLKSENKRQLELLKRKELETESF